FPRNPCPLSGIRLVRTNETLVPSSVTARTPLTPHGDKVVRIGPGWNCTGDVTTRETPDTAACTTSESILPAMTAAVVPIREGLAPRASGYRALTYATQFVRILRPRPRGGGERIVRV